MSDDDALDDVLERFELAWAKSPPADFRDFLLTPEHPKARALLLELIKIDLEYQWRHCIHTLDHYERAMNEYGVDLTLDLVGEEYRVRHRWGDAPDHRVFYDRYGEALPDLVAHLASIDAESEAEERSASNLANDESQAIHLKAGDDVDDFQILNELGDGAFARVYLAQQKSLQRLVALKIALRPSHEPPVLSNLDHPHIVRVYDERVIGEMRLLYMQYVPGGSLSDVIESMNDPVGGDLSGRHIIDCVDQSLRKRGQVVGARLHPAADLDWGQATAWVAARLSDALDHAHQRQIWHRDIKPDNVLLSADGSPLLADFNLSSGELLGESGSPESFGGTFAYMSPEHFEVILGHRHASTVGASSDYFSFAVMIWEMLTGKRPFEDVRDRLPLPQQYKAGLDRRSRGVDVGDLPSGCPGGLRVVLRRCLEPIEEQRVDSAEAMTRRLLAATKPEMDALLFPKTETWATRLTNRPVTWVCIAGVAPNLLISAINIWANNQLTTENFDQQHFDQVEKPVVNLIAYSIGIYASLAILWPISRGLRRQSDGESLNRDTQTTAERHRLVVLSLSVPRKIAAIILLLWLGSGIAFPLWNQLSPLSRVDSADIFLFFFSQCLHGAIAASLTVTFLSPVVLQGILPRFMPPIESPSLRQQLDRYDWMLGRCESTLAIVPLLALLALALTDQTAQSVFIVLAMVGFGGHMATSMLVPVIRSRIHVLKRYVAPTSELMRDPTESR